MRYSFTFSKLGDRIKILSYRKRVLFSILTIVGLSFLLLVSTEILLRIYIHFRYGVAGKSYGIYRADKELGAVHKPNTNNSNSVINNWGFRNSEDIYEQKYKGAIRIYCSGGSTTFCYNLTTEEAWPSILQRKLRKIPGHEYDEVLNAGEICFAISHEFIFAKRFITRLKPDIVILYGTGINEGLAADLLKYQEGKDFDKLLADKQWCIFPRKLDQGRFLKRNSVLIKFLDYYINPWLKKILARVNQKNTLPYKYDYPHPWVIANFDNTLRAYLTFLRHNGCKVVLVRYGDTGAGDGYLKNYIRMFRERAVTIAREEEVVICDFASLVEQLPHRKDLYIEGGVHVTRQGAESLVDTLLPIVLAISQR